MAIKRTDSGVLSSSSKNAMNSPSDCPVPDVLKGLESPSSIDIQILVSRVLHQSSTRNALSAM